MHNLQATVKKGGNKLVFAVFIKYIQIQIKKGSIQQPQKQFE